jgi:CubicO group peptidase (beta-lactamase class C family)
VPALWVTASTNAGIPTQNPLYTYGYAWWLRRFQGHPGFFARGYVGQHIVVIPALDLVVVTTADWRVNRVQSRQQRNSIERLIALFVTLCCDDTTRRVSDGTANVAGPTQAAQAP